MPDGSVQPDTSSNDFFLDKTSVVRLILQHPGTKYILLARYQTCPLDERYFKTDDPAVDALQEHGIRRVFYVQGYWSFVSLPNFRILPGESTLAEAVKRAAHRQLGIEIGELTTVLAVKQPHVQKPQLERLYLHTRDWSGQLHRDVDPFTRFTGKEGHKQGVFEWVHPNYLVPYLHHPEVIKATNRAHRLVDLLAGLPVNS